MHERIVEILVYVLNEARRENKQVGEIDLSVLERKGYSRTEITQAFSWLVDRLKTGSQDAAERSAQESASFRILHTFEKYAITPQAFGYLIQLRDLKIISDVELEQVIERSVVSGFEDLEISDIQAIVVSVVFDDVRGGRQRSEMLYQSNDTIH